VAVCSLECEASYLASKGLQADDGTGGDGGMAAAAALLGGGYEDEDEDEWENEALPPAKRQHVE
jgi:hypothetical protein